MRILAFVLIALAPARLAGQPAASPPLTVERLAPGIAMLHDRGGNVLLFHGPEGNLLVDDEFEAAADALAREIAAINDRPVRYIVNTHWHGDHTGANALLGGRGAVTIAQDNVRQRMALTQTIRGRTIPPSAENMRPLLTYQRGGLLLYFNGDVVRIFHRERAHTDGDSIVYLTRANVLAMGDIFFHRMLPFLDVAAGGTIDGLIDAVNDALALADERTIIIPGHGTVARRADLVAYRDMLVDLRTRVDAAMRQGGSLAQIQQAGLAQRYVTGLGWITPDELIEAIHLSLSQRDRN
jgi:cyclase